MTKKNNPLIRIPSQRKLWVLVWGIVCLCGRASAQDFTTRDSLLEAIAAVKEHEAFKIEPLIALAYWYRNNNEKEQGLQALKEAEKIAERQQQLSWLPQIYDRWSRMNIDENEFFDLTTKVKKLTGRIPTMSEYQIRHFANIVLMMSFLERYEDGLEILFFLEQKAGGHENPGYTHLMVNLIRSELFTTMHDFDRARGYAQKALEFAEAVNDSNQVFSARLSYCFSFWEAAETDSAVGCFTKILADMPYLHNSERHSVLESLTKTLVDAKRYEEAWPFLQQGLEVAESSNDSIYFLIDWAECFWQQGTEQDVLEKYEAVIPVLERSGREFNYGWSQVNLKKGEYYHLKKRPGQALPFLKAALPNVRQDSLYFGRGQRYWRNLKLLIASFESLGQPDSAALYYRELVRSMEKERAEKAAFHSLRKMTGRVESRQQQQLASLHLQHEKQRFWLIGTGIVALLLLVSGSVIFWQSKGLASEKQKSEALLLNILPASIAERLKAGENLIADHFAEATVIFIDMAGFTRLSSEYDPQKITELLNQVFSIIDDLVDTFGLEKIKTIGDCYMAAAGVPVSRQNHLKQTLLFAKQVLQDLDGLTYEDHPIYFKIGIATGNVIAGVIGQKRILYDLWGDTVNTASRLESNGVAGKIQVTREVFDKMKNEFTFEPRGMVEMKGKGKIETFYLQ